MGIDVGILKWWLVGEHELRRFAQGLAFVWNWGSWSYVLSPPEVTIYSEFSHESHEATTKNHRKLAAGTQELMVWVDGFLFQGAFFRFHFHEFFRCVYDFVSSDFNYCNWAWMTSDLCLWGCYPIFQSHPKNATFPYSKFPPVDMLISKWIGPRWQWQSNHWVQVHMGHEAFACHAGPGCLQQCWKL